MSEINDVEFGIILPKFDNEGHRIDSDEHKEIAKELSERFGGVTAIPSALGCWKSDEGELMCEENTILRSVRDTESVSGDVKDKIKEDREFMDKIGEEAGDEFGQAAIMENREKTEVSFVEGDFKESVPKGMRSDKVFDRLI